MLACNGFVSQTKPVTPASPASTSSTPPPPPPRAVVGIGASSGGLTACRELLGATDNESGLAFIVVLHLQPTYVSELARIFARATGLEVTQAIEGEALERNHVYTIPPASRIAVADGRIRLTPRAQDEITPDVIDALLCSLAAEYGAQAIGVLMSGTGDDGVRGVAAIRAAGGRTFAQSPQSAAYPELPQRAQQSGVIDSVASPHDIGRALSQLPPPDHDGAPTPPAAASEGSSANVLDAIIDRLAEGSGVSFKHYRRPMLERRIRHRAEEVSRSDLTGYLNLLNSDPEEVMALYSGALIHVTGFFRDPEVGDSLRDTILPALLANRPSNAPLRVWVAGCATGEEAYSWAILASEALEAAHSRSTSRIFASDLSERALATARAGFYSEAKMASVSPERLARYFTAVRGGYRVSEELRSRCVFARHDVTRDPPFSLLDVVSCRNLLIYLHRQMQEKVLSTFHYALKPGGLLLLGAAESASVSAGLFTITSPEHKVYTRADVPGRPQHLGGGYGPATATRTSSDGAPPVYARDDVAELLRGAQHALRAAQAPPSVVVDDALVVVLEQGDCHEYLAQVKSPGGTLLARLRPELRAPLERLIASVRTTGVRAREVGIALDREDRKLTELAVVPIAVNRNARGGFLVLLGDGTESSTVPRLDARPPVSPEQRVTELERELRELRAELWAGYASTEMAGSEYQNAYEEAISFNEELQSTNEELETTREELQSTNEELSTVNDELRERNVEFSHTIADLGNVLDSANLPLLVLDRNLYLRRFSPRAEIVFGMRQSDVGLPLAPTRHDLLPADTLQECHRVLQDELPQERELQDAAGRWWTLRLLPCRGPGGTTDGVVLVLHDVNDSHLVLAASEAAREHSELVLDAIWEPVVVIDAADQIVSANPAFRSIFQDGDAGLVGHDLYALEARDLDIPELRTLIERARASGEETVSAELTHDFVRLGHRVLQVKARSLRAPASSRSEVLVAIEDVTEARSLQQRLRNTARIEAVGLLAGGVAHDLNNQLTGVIAFAESLVEGLAADDVRQRETQEIKAAALRMAATTRQLLAFGRRQRLAPRAIELNALLIALTPLLRRLLGAEIRVLADFPDVQAWILADPASVEQVLLNLAVNAKDAMPGGGEFRLATEQIVVDDDYARRHGAPNARRGAYVRLSVSDTGAGMSAETQAHLFEPFFTTKGVTSGSGLGLASVYGTVTQSDGWISVHSELGAGTTFHIDLPAGVPDSAAGSVAKPAPGASRGTETILVVDDEPIVLRATSRALVRAGYDILTAGGSADAIAVLRATARPVHLVLSDVTMPGMGGQLLGEHLVGEWPELPILYMSGHPLEELVRRKLATPAMPLVAKPFTARDLAAEVRAMLDRRPRK
jgi:two-component system, chemotaxis family, CheB/CheR fusion protein